MWTSSRDGRLETEAAALASSRNWQYLAPTLGHELGTVVHDDDDASRVASNLSATALTVGNEIWIDRRRTPAGTESRRSVIAHEFAHVWQQQGVGRWVQRLPFVDTIALLMRLNSMTDIELQRRHDDIVAILAKATQSSPENEQLKAEAAEIGVILARRAGRIFDSDDIARMRKYFEDNANKAKPESCIACLNKGIRILLQDKHQKVSGSVDTTAALLQASGHAGPVETVDFKDRKGRPTTGTLAPNKLRESVWDKVITMAHGDQGWSVFVMSLMDGYHSVTLSLDNHDPSHPRMYWSDQWSEKGGFKEYNKAGLDAEIEHLTSAWWAEEAAGTGESAQKTGQAVKMNTVVRVYRLLGTARPAKSTTMSEVPAGSSR